MTHPSPNNDLNKSIAAVDASYTSTTQTAISLGKCFSKLVVQEKASKEIVNLKKIATDLLKDYQKVKKSYPKKIIVFRDGIGEGDFEKVIRSESDEIKKACQELNRKETKITFISVQKR